MLQFIQLKSMYELTLCRDYISVTSNGPCTVHGGGGVLWLILLGMCNPLSHLSIITLMIIEIERCDWLGASLYPAIIIAR